MPVPCTIDEFLELTRQSNVLDDSRLTTYLNQLQAPSGTPTTPAQFAGIMVRDGLLTPFQAQRLLEGKWRGFIMSNKYRVLEHVGSGGMGSVYLCEHLFMKRRVALKLLPPSQAQDPAVLERFYREARAAATLNHPNIVRTYDIDQEDRHHFLVMEFVDGTSLQDLVEHHGPLAVLRACHYIRQAALGLQRAHKVGLVHRDIKPANILVDRDGVVKILDMGLARFFRDDNDPLTQQHEGGAVLGTADYLAPEQAVDSHDVDSRADIYSLGATFYFLLTGRSPFQEGTTMQKMLWHQMRLAQPVRELRPEVPAEVAAILERMMAKAPTDRYPQPVAVAEALEPWGGQPIAPPAEAEMPRLCPALRTASESAVALAESITSKVDTQYRLEDTDVHNGPDREALLGSSGIGLGQAGQDPRTGFEFDEDIRILAPSSSASASRIRKKASVPLTAGQGPRKKWVLGAALAAVVATGAMGVTLGLQKPAEPDRPATSGSADVIPDPGQVTSVKRTRSRDPIPVRAEAPAPAGPAPPQPSATAPAIASTTFSTITIDGKFADWADVPSHTDPANNEHDTDHKLQGDTPQHVNHADVDILEYKFTHDADNLYAYIRSRGVIGRTQAEEPGKKAGQFYAIIAINVDQDEKTGYWLHEGGYYPTSGGYDVNAKLEWYNNRLNAGYYLNHCCLNQQELDQAFLDQSSGQYRKGVAGPYQPGFLRLGAGTYKYYTEWVYHDDDRLTFVRDGGPRTMGIIQGAVSADGHELEMKIPMKGFLKDRSGQPIIRLGQKLNISMSLEASGELAADKKWACNTAAPILGYVLEPPRRK